jgi:hypothetical protein
MLCIPCANKEKRCKIENTSLKSKYYRIRMEKLKGLLE